MDFERLPPQLRMVLHTLGRAVSSREPAIRGTVQLLREANPHLTNDQLALKLIRSTRRRVAATGAISGAVSIAPGLGTILAVGTLTSQALYALEQEIELVLSVAMIYGHELGSSNERMIEALVVVGITSGAVKLREDVLVAGGERADIGTGKGYFFQPTVFDHVDPGMTIAREEIFGPVLAAIEFTDLDEAIARANDSQYGLAAAVWTRDIKKAHYVARRLQAGTVWINTYNVYDTAAPFGGYKASGFGREMSAHALEHYTQVKSVWVDLNM